jgi:hypothetical protein
MAADKSRTNKDRRDDEADGPSETPEVPLNRAERRGHAKGGSRPQPAGRGKVAGQSGKVQGPRLWSNRRGGS